MKSIFCIVHFLGLFCMNITLAQGNVGIGTLNPQAKLDIIGSIKITDGTQGAGKVLTSNAAGLATWEDLDNHSSSGSEYPVVWIGCNPWMTSNLNVSTYRNGDPIPKVTNASTWASLTTGAYCYYQNDSATYAAVYGKLYNWYAINDPRGLAPEGWHIASDFEWTTLVNTLGGEFVAGGMMKQTGTDHWNDPNTGATNLCNFTALPGGQRNAAGTFSGEGDFGNWWSGSSDGFNIGWYRKLNSEDMDITAGGSDLNFGYSVRCIRD